MSSASPRLQVAVPFIDRHVGEGRGAKAVIRTATETVTYAELAERVNRTGNALLGAGLEPGDRMLMVVKDCPAFFYLFWGAIKAGIVPVPPNTLLRAKDYEFMISDSGCAAVIYSSRGEVEPPSRLGKPRHVAHRRQARQAHRRGAGRARAAPGQAHG
jgi:acyl-coenzyme A synthetase/AMP-(fatty) acid ligase